MKVLPSSIITGITASTSNANYPVANLSDVHPQKLWKATAATALLTVSIAAGSNGFALFNTNATGVSFQLLDPNEIDWEAGVDWESGVEWANTELSSTQVTDLDGISGACLCEWDTVNAPVVLLVSLANSAGTVIHAGVAVAGEFLSNREPKYGLTENIVDYSIEDEFSNGSVYIKDRAAVRVFGCSVDMERDDEFHNFVFGVAKVVKKNPAAWVITDLDNSRWLTYARFTRMPRGDHFTVNRTQVQFELTEVV